MLPFLAPSFAIFIESDFILYTHCKYIAILLCTLSQLSLSAQIEICDNGIDDDNDMLIDLNDDDCACEVIEPTSLIPNPSFEKQNCCPNDRSQLNCATNWIQASEPTTDFIHLCDWLGWDDFPPPQPFPDGEGIMGFRDGRVRNNNTKEPYWKEYAGACLTSPLIKDTTYRFQFDVGFVSALKSPPIDISFFGTADCTFLPFGVGNESFGCPTNSPNWRKLGEVRVSGGNGSKWVNTSIEITPDEDIYAIAIGPDCPPVDSEVSIYYFFDNLLLADIASFNLQISEEEHPCSDDYALSVPNNSVFDYQWYRNGIALEGEVFSELMQNYGTGSYQVRILDGVSCKVSASFEHSVPEFIEMPRVTICDGDVYEFGDADISAPGVYLDTFKTEDNCDRIVTLEVEVIGATYDTVEVEILEGETYFVEDLDFNKPGDYPLMLNSSIGCDSLVLLKLTNFTIYIPNIFSPNRDGQNDIFEVFSQAGKIENTTMYIYDRWGNLIYSGTEWNGQGVGTGVYTYRIDITFSDGLLKEFYGSVTLVK